MNKYIILSIILYLILINIITVSLTVSDKRRAKKNQIRIPEKSLICMALLGGAVSEYLTMKLIRHKTLHNKFMIGLPLIIILQIIFLFIILYLLQNQIFVN